jgi:hypothetical protein
VVTSAGPAGAPELGLATVGDGNNVGMCRAPPALLGTVVDDTCGVKPGKYPGWYGGAGEVALEAGPLNGVHVKAKDRNWIKG